MIDIAETSRREMRAVLRDLGKLDAGARKRVQTKFRAATEKVAAVIRDRMPKRTGNMAKRTKGGARAGQAEIRGRAEYTRIVERGGMHPVWGETPMVIQKAQPTIFPTVREMNQLYYNDANRALDEELRELNFK